MHLFPVFIRVRQGSSDVHLFVHTLVQLCLSSDVKKPAPQAHCECCVVFVYVYLNKEFVFLTQPVGEAIGVECVLSVCFVLCTCRTPHSGRLVAILVLSVIPVGY